MNALTPNEIAVLLHGEQVIESRRARSRAVNSLVAQKLLYGCDHTPTPAGEAAIAKAGAA